MPFEKRGRDVMNVRERGFIRPKDICVVAHGTKTGLSGTDLIQVVKID